GLGETKLGEDAVHVLGDRSLRHPQPASDPDVRATLSHEREHLTLARRQLDERVVDSPRRDELLNERRVNDRAALDDALERLEEVIYMRAAALQQIPAPLATGEEPHGMLHFNVRRENEDPHIRVLLADRVRRLETFRRMRRWHPDVDQ